MRNTLIISLVSFRVCFSALVASELTDLPATAVGNAIDIPTQSGFVRSSQWAMPQGTLFPNWSFENSDQFWSLGSGIRFSGTASGNLSGALTGKYEMMMNLNSSAVSFPISGKVLLRAGTTYTLSYMVRGLISKQYHASWSIFDPVNPGVAEAGPIIGSKVITGNMSSAWNVINEEITPTKNRLYQFRLIDGIQGASGDVAFVDDALLVEGPTAVANQVRSAIFETGAVSDPTGLVFHTLTKSSSDPNYMLNAVGYDAFMRPESTYLPYQVALATAYMLPTDNYSASKSYNRLAGSTPASVVRYPNANRPGRSEALLTGDAWNSDARKIASGSYLVSTVPTTSVGVKNLLVGVTSFSLLEKSSVTTGEKSFRLNWSRDPDGNYKLSWSNALGQSVASAALLSKQGQPDNPSQWNWALTTYEYYPTGQLKRVITPLSASVNPVVNSYDLQGRLIATKSPDEGLMRYWYDAAGRLRFRQSARQLGAAKNEYTYFRYDKLGRLISEGEVNISGFSQSNVDDPDYGNSFSPTERKGWIYDDLDSKWPSDLPSLSVVRGSAWNVGAADGQLVAKYHRNPQNTGMGLTAEQRLVADFYSYDTRGRLSSVGKYMGGVADVANRRQNVEYRYDSAGRMGQQLVDRNMDARTLSNDATRAPDAQYKYTYDDKGRISQILDGNTSLASYTYDALGRLVNAVVGASAARFVNSFHVHGQLAGSDVFGNNILQYAQKLGYEADVNAAAAPPSATPSFSGRITQSYQQYGLDQNVLNLNSTAIEALKAENFSYDPAGRLTQVRGMTGVVISAGQSGVAGPATWSDQTNLSSTYVYDDNDRIDLATIGGTGTSADYVYKSGSNQLDRVTNWFKIGNARDASASGTFSYDSSGQLVDDKSKRKTMTWDAEGLLASVVVVAPGSKVESRLWPLYDADGMMVSSLQKTAKFIPLFDGDLDLVSIIRVARQTGATHYVRMAGTTQKEIRESWNWGNLTGATSIVNLQGRASVIGRKIAGNYQFYIKNHQGSTVRVVDATGRSVSSYDYLSYGDLRTLRGQNPEVTEKYTGKGYDDATGLYYFGARWFDAELGIWVSPDPAHQFNSPYAFGTAPVLGTDPNGLMFNPFDGDDWSDLGSDIYHGTGEVTDWVYHTSGDAKDWTYHASGRLFDWLCPGKSQCRASASMDCGTSGCGNPSGDASISDGNGGSAGIHVGGGETQQNSELAAEAAINAALNDLPSLEEVLQFSTKNRTAEYWPKDPAGEYEMESGETAAATKFEKFYSDWHGKLRGEAAGQYGNGAIGNCGASPVAACQQYFPGEPQVRMAMYPNTKYVFHSHPLYYEGKLAALEQARRPSVADYNYAAAFYSNSGAVSFLRDPFGNYYLIQSRVTLTGHKIRGYFIVTNFKGLKF